MIRQTELYCYREDNQYRNFYPTIIQVKMCGENKNNIVKVIVKEANKNEIPTHWGWWSNDEQRFSMIYSNIVGVKMCFPYGYEIEVKDGKGDIYGLVIKEVYNT